MELEQKYTFTPGELNKLEAWIVNNKRPLALNEFEDGALRQVAILLERVIPEVKYPLFTFDTKYSKVRKIRSRKE